jgi:protein arginine N-methyltransferase 1
MICSDTCKIIDFDLVHMKKEDVNFSATYRLKIHKNSTASALVSWFDCHFEGGLKRRIILSTSPYQEYTHWKNTIFYVNDAYQVNNGDILSGSIAVR